MAKKYYAWGKSATDAIVGRFLERKGISPADISGYTITRNIEDPGTITLSMHWDDEPAEAEIYSNNSQATEIRPWRPSRKRPGSRPWPRPPASTGRR